MDAFSRGAPHWNDATMGIRISYFVESPEERIPSLIRAEASEEVVDFRGIPAEALTKNLPFQPRFSSTEGESGVFGGPTKEAERGRVGRVIQCVAQVTDNVPSKEPNVARDFVNKLDFENLFPRLAVKIDNVGVWLDRKEGLDELVELVIVLMRPVHE